MFDRAHITRRIIEPRHPDKHGAASIFYRMSKFFIGVWVFRKIRELISHDKIGSSVESLQSDFSLFVTTLKHKFLYINNTCLF